MSASAESFPVHRVTPTGSEDTRDMLAVEEPLEIRLVTSTEEDDTTASHPERSRRMTERAVSITMRTPGADEELSAGFLFTEGILQNSEDIAGISCGQDPSGNVVRIELVPGVSPSLKSLDRNFYTTSSCGVCGKASVDAVKIASKYTSKGNPLTVTGSLLNSLQEKLRASQKVFEATGGLHASALFDREGKLQLVREDVGRHNALDKLIGASFMQKKMPLKDSILLLSGRISFELVQKASMAGIPIVAAIGAPSSLAVSVAEECGMTLVGFLRENRFTVYCGKERINVF